MVSDIALFFNKKILQCPKLYYMRVVKLRYLICNIQLQNRGNRVIVYRLCVRNAGFHKTDWHRHLSPGEKRMWWEEKDLICYFPGNPCLLLLHIF